MHLEQAKGENEDACSWWSISRTIDLYDCLWAVKYAYAPICESNELKRDKEERHAPRLLGIHILSSIILGVSSPWASFWVIVIKVSVILCSNPSFILGDTQKRALTFLESHNNKHPFQPSFSNRLDSAVEEGRKNFSYYSHHTASTYWEERTLVIK